MPSPSRVRISTPATARSFVGLPRAQRRLNLLTSIAALSGNAGGVGGHCGGGKGGNAGGRGGFGNGGACGTGSGGTTGPGGGGVGSGGGAGKGAHGGLGLGGLGLGGGSGLRGGGKGSGGGAGLGGGGCRSITCRSHEFERTHFDGWMSRLRKQAKAPRLATLTPSHPGVDWQASLQLSTSWTFTLASFLSKAVAPCWSQQFLSW